VWLRVGLSASPVRVVPAAVAPSTVPEACQGLDLRSTVSFGGVVICVVGLMGGGHLCVGYGLVEWMFAPKGAIKSLWNIKEFMTKPIAADEIITFVTEVFERADMPVQDAKSLAQELVDAELSGYASVGLRKVGEYLDRVQRNVTNANPEITVDLDKGALARVDGDNGFGHLVVDFATQLAIERAKEYGLAGVGVHNANFAGRLGGYARNAADHGIATIMFANTGGAIQVVSAPGGTEPRLSTAPIAAGFPRAGEAHFVLDFATSSVAYSRLGEAKDLGEDIPAEWTNASGDLVPFGGYKGFGLALLAETLAGALTTAGMPSEQPSADEQGLFLLAIDVGSLRDVDEFQQQADEFLEYVKATPLAAGASEIRVPGEQSEKARQHGLKHGLHLAAHVAEDFRQVAKSLNMNVPWFIQAN